KITRRAIADDLASAAHVIMGETGRRVPAVLIRGSRVKLEDSTLNSETFIPPDKCLFSSIYIKRVKKLHLDPLNSTSTPGHQQL
ncbi:MAG: coenzyme F420-0:L-glutamate ligase, partial [Thaumarchaeota archaeon]|nr:coenzyme F420-0:L-glutamate ligase [Nitrososphaerota archaeon]